MNSGRISPNANIITVPFVDLKTQTEAIKDEINKALSRTLSKCDFILGEDVNEFERKFAKYIGCKEAIGVSSGLDALILALKALNIHEGAEVLLPVNTFIATAFAVSAVNAKPVFIDCDENFNIDCSKIESKINENTKAIIPVHLTGHPCNMGKIMDISKKYKLYVVEDSAQAHGATYRNRKCGSIGDMGCFSFYPGKNLGAFGDGGLIATNNSNIADVIRCLRNYGQKIKYEHGYVGFNNRLDTIQASILIVKLKYLEEWNNLRIKNAHLYAEFLKDIDEIKTPKVLAGYKHVFHLYMVVCKRRNELQKFLKQKGIETGIHYPKPIHLQQCYKGLGYINGDFPVAEELAGEILSLPMFPELKEEQIRYVTTCIKEFYFKG